MTRLEWLEYSSTEMPTTFPRSCIRRLWRRLVLTEPFYQQKGRAGGGVLVQAQDEMLCE